MIPSTASEPPAMAAGTPALAPLLAGAWLPGADAAGATSLLAGLSSGVPPWLRAPRWHRRGPLAVLVPGASGGGPAPTSPRPLHPAVAAGAPKAALLAWDGRLDNRGDLARHLRLDLGAAGGAVGGSRGEPADGELVLAAWRRWGERTADRLLGDWALALWLPSLQRMVLARDPIGTRPLFYRHLPGRGWLWSCRLAPLAAAAPTRLDPVWAAGYLGRCPGVEETPWAEIRAVAPGSMVVLRREGAEHRTFWRPLPQDDLDAMDDGELEDRYGELFERSVARRLRTSRPVGAELSGGLDSSTIVCTARDLMRDERGRAPALLPVSFVHADSRLADEERWVRCVEEHTGLVSHRVVQERFPLLTGLDSLGGEIPGARDCEALRHREAARHLHTRGAGVLLRGIGGDELLWSEMPLPLELPDLLRRGRLGTLARSLHHWGATSSLPYGRLLLDGALYPALPAALRRRFGHQAPHPDSWIDPRFARRHDLGRRMFWEHRVPAGLAPASLRLRVFQVMEAIRVVGADYHRDPYPVVTAHPFLDRELVEFCLALPLRQLARGGETRRIHRRTVGLRVPRPILERRLKTSMEEALVRGLERTWPQVAALAAAPLCADLGWIDGHRFRAALRTARYGRSRGAARLFGTLALEAWLRRCFGAT